jgi:hypothetical protein
MAAQQILHIRLPEEVSPANAELLKATFQAIMALRCDCSSEWDRTLRELETDGWSVGWKLTWIAEAKRGGDFEQASGKTLDEVFSRLQQLTRLDMVAGCP